jgi:hypothetical protein
MRKGIALPFLLLLASVAFILGAFFVFDNKPNSLNQNSTQTQSPLPTAETYYTEESDITNWKTYTNTQAGYSIQYPPDWATRVRNDLNYGFGPSIELYTSDPFSNFVINIATASNSKKLSLEKPRDLFGSGPLEEYVLPPGIEVKETLLGGYKAFRLDHCCGGYNGVEAEIKTIKNNKIYDLIITPDSQGNSSVNDIKKKKILNQILSTFKFVE